MISPHRMEWARVGRAIYHFESNGYVYVEVPWAVEPSITQITTPNGVLSHKVGEKDLVGSAEQSFLSMLLGGTLPRGKYVTCTPCFRSEPVLDALHQQAFLKVELIDARHGPDYLALLKDAQRFFMGEGVSTVRSVKQDSRNICWPQEDLVAKGVELGSYGRREHGDLTWAYGTGLAEPRFSYVRGLS